MKKKINKNYIGSPSITLSLKELHHLVEIELSTSIWKSFVVPYCISGVTNTFVGIVNLYICYKVLMMCRQRSLLTEHKL